MTPRVAATHLLLSVLACWGCAEPYEAVLKRQQLVADADQKFMEYVCPEARQLQPEAKDPLRAAIDFVQHARELEGWADELSYPPTPPPARFAGPLDSLRAAIAVIASSFTPAVARAAVLERECYGEFSVQCSKSVRAGDIFSQIDGVALRRGRDAYFRHRAALAELFAKADAPLGALKTCGEG